MGYPREEIDKVRDAVDLAELASEVTKVRRSGRSVMAVCPFHQEKTPSLSIDAARGLFHCFGCGESGDVIQWVQKVDNTDFRGAVEILARRSGIALTEEDPGAAKRRGERERLVSAVAAAVDFYSERLKSAPDAGGARSYLRGRGYGIEVVDRFGLGYSPNEWDALTRTLRDQGVSDKALLGSGLASRSNRGTLVDRFRGRLMFPITDLRGDPVGFGARLLDGEGPKYLNSPETPIYHKSRLLYGLDKAKSDIVRRHEAVVVEGYTDVIAFHLAERPVAVATCGTALGEDHLDLLRRFTDRIILAFDADAAGAGAANRGFDLVAGADLDLRVAKLPEGQDPADLVSAGEVEHLMKVVDDSEPLLRFKIDRELAKFDLSEPEGRGRAVRAATELVMKHPDDVARHEYGVYIARRTGVELDVIQRSLRPQRSRQERGSARPPRKLTGTEKAERELLRLLLANDPGLRDVDLTADLLVDSDHRAAFDRLAPLVLSLPPGEPPDLGAMLGDQDLVLGDTLRELALTDRPLADPSELVIKLKEGALERRMEEQRRILGTIDPDQQPEEYSRLFAELIALEKQRRDLRSGG